MPAPTTRLEESVGSAGAEDVSAEKRLSDEAAAGGAGGPAEPVIAEW